MEELKKQLEEIEVKIKEAYAKVQDFTVDYHKANAITRHLKELKKQKDEILKQLGRSKSV